MSAEQLITRLALHVSSPKTGEQQDRPRGGIVVKQETGATAAIGSRANLLTLALVFFATRIFGKTMSDLFH